MKLMYVVFANFAMAKLRKFILINVYLGEQKRTLNLFGLSLQIPIFEEGFVLYLPENSTYVKKSKTL